MQFGILFFFLIALQGDTVGSTCKKIGIKLLSHLIITRSFLPPVFS